MIRSLISLEALKAKIARAKPADNPVVSTNIATIV